MSVAEFRHWLALYQLEPWGDEWDQVRAIAAASIAPWSKRKIRLEKFFPQPPKPDGQTLEQRLEMFIRRHNAKCDRVERQQASARRATALSQSRRRRTRQRNAKRQKDS
jgi:uncharacterized protein YdaU (DUF1376 family)